MYYDLREKSVEVDPEDIEAVKARKGPYPMRVPLGRIGIHNVQAVAEFEEDGKIRMGNRITFISGKIMGSEPQPIELIERTKGTLSKAFLALRGGEASPSVTYANALPEPNV